MSEAASKPVADRGSVRALSALAGLAPLTVTGLVQGGFAVVSRASGVYRTADMDTANALASTQYAVTVVCVVLAALATGWILQRSGSVRWGVLALTGIGLVDAWGRLLNLLNVFGGMGQSYSGVPVATPFFAYTVPVLLLAGLVLLGAWLRRWRAAR